MIIQKIHDIKEELWHLLRLLQTELRTAFVNSAKVLDGTIVDADISSSANIAATKFGFACQPPTWVLHLLN